MGFFSWRRDQKQHRSRTRPGFRPALESLDDRIVPSTLTVTTNIDSGIAGDGSLRGEIAAAQSGDTIVFDANLSGQSINLYTNAAVGELVINKNLTIQGPSSPLSPATINGGYSRIFEVDGAKTIVSLSNLNIDIGNGVADNPLSAGATDGEGGAIWNGGTLTISACNLSNNSTPLGGAIYNAGTLTVSNSTLDNNSAGQKPAFDPTYGGDGGAIYNAGTLTVSNSTLNNNAAYKDDYGHDYGYGGGIFNAYRASATVTGSSLSGNFAFDAYGRNSGDIYNDGVMTLSGSTVSDIFNDKKGHLAINSVSSADYLLNLGVVKISADSGVGVIVK